MVRETHEETFRERLFTQGAAGVYIMSMEEWEKAEMEYEEEKEEVEDEEENDHANNTNPQKSAETTELIERMSEHSAYWEVVIFSLSLSLSWYFL